MTCAGSARRWSAVLPTLVRFMARMPGYIYAQDPDGVVFVNLYVSSATEFEMGGGTLGLSVESEMPWGGRSSISVSAEQDLEGTIRLRIPGWARDVPDPEGLYTYTDRLEAAGSGVRERPSRGRGARPAGVRVIDAGVAGRRCNRGRAACGGPQGGRGRSGFARTGAGSRSSAAPSCTVANGPRSRTAKSWTCFSTTMSECKRASTPTCSGDTRSSTRRHEA